MKKSVSFILALLILCVGVTTYAEDAMYEYDDLSGSWRTVEGDEGFTTLLLYPEDAFRLYEYHINEEETFTLEGVRVVEDDEIIVSDVRLGKLDSDGNFTVIEEKDSVRFMFSLEFVDETAELTLTDEQGNTIILYPFDMDSPE
jgi:hypothetical protein